MKIRERYGTMGSGGLGNLGSALAIDSGCLFHLRFTHTQMG